MKVICTICARGGSQGVKNKNLLNLLGKPLIAHTILQAKKSDLFECIVVSSDSKKIRDIALQWGADVVIDRPEELASATAGKLPAIQHAVNRIEKQQGCLFDMIVDLDVTSPLRVIDDIQQSVQLLSNSSKAGNLVTAAPSRRSPYFNMLEKKADGFVKLVTKNKESIILRRQDTPPCYDMNASIYVWKRKALFQKQQVITNSTLLYVMPEERSVDIDTPFDLKIVRLLARNRRDLAD